MSPTIESSPTRGGEAESPPPRGSRRLRDRARHVPAPGAQALLGPRARASARSRARCRVRAAAARGEHLGVARTRRDNRRAQARSARSRSAPHTRRAAGGRQVNAPKKANAGLVRLPVWRGGGGSGGPGGGGGGLPPRPPGLAGPPPPPPPRQDG